MILGLYRDSVGMILGLYGDYRAYIGIMHGLCRVLYRVYIGIMGNIMGLDWDTGK